MNWINLTTKEQLEQIREKSTEKPQVIFKHSTRCSISSMAKSRLERGNQPEGMDFYYLDLIAQRELSSTVAEDFAVSHESPQILIIKNGNCVYDASHSAIRLDDIANHALAT
ncbi:MAG: bacillithiol system redox-active protein YtxJ [Chitinophagaceae bacterium]